MGQKRNSQVIIYWLYSLDAELVDKMISIASITIHVLSVLLVLKTLRRSHVIDLRGRQCADSSVPEHGSPLEPTGTG